MKKYQIENKKKFIISISIVILSIIIISAIVYITSIKRNTQTTSSSDIQNTVDEEVVEGVNEFANLQDLTSVNNKTKEELQEINKKEIEKNKVNKTDNKTTNKNNTVNKNKYYIKVNYGAQVVNVYTYDEKGKYTVPVKAFVCSTGIETPTSGVYKIPAKIKWCFMYGDVYAQYCTQIVGDILFHSVPYLKRSNDTLEYWAYDKLGTKDSLGCVRLTARDAKWIFDNIPYGTQVEFYSSSNPGPLGKPTAQKISNAPNNLRNWDPTDPDSRNPWKTYKPEKDKTNNDKDAKNEIKNTEVDNTINNEEENNTNQISNNEEIINSVTNNEETTNENQNNQQSNNTTEKEETNINNKTENKETNNIIENTELTNM